MQIPANEIRPGDVIYFLGTPHLVSAIEPYDGPFDFISGIARADDGWGISLEDGATLDAYRAPTTQTCRDCGKSFPYDEARDRCPACVADAIGETRRPTPCECGEHPVARDGLYICVNASCDGFGQVCGTVA